MKAILNKRQIQTVMLLFAVIFVLLCGVAFTVSTRQSAPAAATPVGGEKPPHAVLRAARVSANERIAWETNFGGTADETPQAVFEKNGEIYIFGNTNSHDLDFAGLAEGKTRGFGARLSAEGRTLGFTVFDFTVAKAVPTLSGFAVAGNEGSAAGLYLLSDSLTVTGKAVMAPTHALTACGLYIFDNRYFLLAQSYDEITERTSLLLHVYTVGLSLEREKVFAHTYSLRPLELLPYRDGYLLAAAASFQNSEHLTLARFTTLSEPAYTDFSFGYAYTPTAFLPLGGGYAAISDKGGNCELLLLNESLVKTDIKFLTETPNAHKKTLLYAGGTFAYTGESLVELGDGGRIVGAVPYAPEQIRSFCHNGVAAFIAGTTGDGVTIACIGRQKTDVFTVALASPAAAALCALPEGLLLTSTTKAVTADCRDCFGGNDVYVSYLRL